MDVLRNTERVRANIVAVKKVLNILNVLYIMVQLMHLFCNKTLIQISHTKTFKITPACFDHPREPSDPG
jgi:hypothetical protein